MDKGKNYFALNKWSNGVFYYNAHDEDGRRYKRSTGMVSNRVSRFSWVRERDIGSHLLS